MSFLRKQLSCLPLLLLLVNSVAALAADVTEPAAADVQAAFAAAEKTVQRGPADVTLADQATLKLPANFAFVPAKEAAGILQAWGNRAGDELIGMVFPSGETADNWFVVIQFDKAGYIKDDDAKDWNADDLLQSLKDGTDHANEERRKRGIAEMEIVGWVEPPHYDSTTRQLVWSIASRDKGAADSAEKGINYNTYSLGRDGYISMNLVTDLKAIETHKPIAKTLLGALSFRDGERYADFDASTDKVAAYGLAALVAGVAAKKLGMFALLAGVLVKFWKLIAIGFVAFGGGLAKWWKGRKSSGGTPS
ncbi:MAG: DUF2167 domain-containing protein [Gammaproteobacteria bacterium]|nr:DUF2167 domain-containing protein [Gammaproteobacteria bacterium]